MERSLSAFLAQNAKQVDNRTYAASPRFVDKDGKPMEWEICCISASENAKLRKGCMKSIPVPGKRGQFTQDFDTHAYQAKLAARCVVFPDLNSVELQESYGVMGAEQLAATMLTGGEFDRLVATILELNGFVDENEAVDEAKN